MVKTKTQSIKMIVFFLFVFMFVLAITSTVIGVLVPEMQGDYTLSYDRIGYLSSIQNAGGFLVMLIGGILSDKFSKLHLIGVFVLIYTVSLLFVGMIPPYLLLLVLFFLIGAMVNGLSMLVSAYISESCGEKAVSYLNLSHGFYGIGSLLGPVYATVLFSLHLHWRVLYITLGITCGLILIVYLFLLAGKKDIIRKDIRRSAAVNDRKPLKSVQLLRLCIACGVFMGQQTAFSTWITSYALEKVTSQSSLANMVTSLYWMGIAAGRFLQSAWSKRIDPIESVARGCIAAAVLSTIGIASGNIWVLLPAAAASGICSGAAFPNIIDAGGRSFPTVTGAATSLICLAGSLGGIIFPWLMAKIISYSYFAGLMISPVCMMITALILARFLMGKKGEQPI